jgi:predicted nucleic acid-binding protein
MKKSWVYFDTSTFLKLYVKERGSEKARSIAGKSFILSSAILPVEAFSALSRKRLFGEMSDNVFNKLINRVKGDLQYIEIVRVGDEVLKKAEDIVLNLSCRTLDAIHIASALIFEEASGIKLKFVTSDKRQHEIADHHNLLTLFVGG